MSLDKRLTVLENRIPSKGGCDATLLIVHEGDTVDMRPTSEEIEIYLNGSELCKTCRGSCFVDWSPVNGFENQTLTNGSNNSSTRPRVSTIFMADRETGGLIRRIANGEREQEK